MRTVPFFILSALFVNIPSLTLQAQTKDAPKTLMLQPGKLVVSDELSQPFGKDWFANKGKWDVVDGVMRAAELPADMHAAVRRRNVKFDSAIVQFGFKFDGATMGSLSMNAEQGHVCRVRFTPTGFTIIRDKDKANSGKAIEMDTCKIDLKPGAWHTMVVEMAGKDMLARLDDKSVAFGSNPGLTTPKASVGFTVKGDSMSFKNLRVYEGTPLKSWDETRAKLTAERKK
jgi:hypothetical protein